MNKILISVIFFATTLIYVTNARVFLPGLLGQKDGMSKELQHHTEILRDDGNSFDALKGIISFGSNGYVVVNCQFDQENENQNNFEFKDFIQNMWCQPSKE